MTKEIPWEYDLSVEKLASDKEGNLYIAGFASNGDQDEDGEVMDLESLKKVYEDYMKNPVIKLMHDKVPQWKGAIGRVVPEYTDLEGEVHKTSFSSKPYLVIKLAQGLPEWIYSSVKDGIYKGLSIGGKLAMKVGNRLYVKSWLETSLVDIPSAKGSFVNVLKAAGGVGEKTIPPQDGITKELQNIQGQVSSRRIEESSSGINSFLKGGKGSGIKGHTTYYTKEQLAARYKKDSMDLKQALQGALSDLVKLDERGRDMVKRGEGLVSQGKEKEGEELKHQGEYHIKDAALKKKEFTDKHAKAQTELSQKYLDDLKENGHIKAPENKPPSRPSSPYMGKEVSIDPAYGGGKGIVVDVSPRGTHVTVELKDGTKQIHSLSDVKIKGGVPEGPQKPVEAPKEVKPPEFEKPPEDEGERKKAARRERAKKRREAKQGQETPKGSSTAGASETPKESTKGRSEEQKAKQRERAKKRREAKAGGEALKEHPDRKN